MRRGESAAFELLLKRHAKIVGGAMARYRLPGAERDDLLSVVHTALWNAACTYDPTAGSFHTWAWRIVRARCIEALHAATRLKCAPLTDSRRFEEVTGETGRTLADVVPAPDVQRVESVAEQRDELRRLTLVMRGRLTPIERAAVLTRANGRTYLEQASAHGVTAKAIDNARFRGLAKLRAAA